MGNIKKAKPRITKNRSIRRIVVGYIRDGFCPIPVPHGEKAPTKKGWQKLRILPDDVPEYFEDRDQNIGVLLGKPSAGLVDIDLDCDEAVRLAPEFLPKTSAIFGRKSRPRSHWLYDAPGAKTKKYQCKEGMLVELRSTGMQTLFPPSVHPEDEPIRWCHDGDPAEVDTEDLVKCCGDLAAASLLARRWPATGSRHDTAMALAGAMLRAGWEAEEAEWFIGTVAEAAGDDEVDDRIRTVADTKAKLDEKSSVTGLTRLGELLGDETARLIGEWLGLQAHDGSPVIQVRGGELPQQVKQAEAALLATPEHGVYQRAGRLVTPVRTARMETLDGVTRVAGALTLQNVTAPQLVEKFTECATWIKIDGRSGARKRIDCPPRVAQTYLHHAGSWRVPVLEGFVEAPTLRPDGSILETPGYDANTGLIFASDDVFPPIPQKPTKRDADRALDKLDELLKGFPFVTYADWSVAVAAILTGLVRRSIRSAPLFGKTAPTSSSGKSLLADVVSLIVSGRNVPTSSQSRSAEEDQKVLLAVLLKADQVVCIDNVDRPIHGDTLCTILTQQTYRGRVLGHSQMAEVPTNCLFLATGNNLTFAGDMATRALLCTMDPQMERPEERTFDVDLRRYIPEHRGELVQAALTILRAYHIAGRPPQKVKPFGRFEDWSDWVRCALVWLGEADPCKTREKIESADPWRQELTAVLEAWFNNFGDRLLTVSKACNKLDQTNTKGVVNELREALVNVAPDSKGDINTRALGKWLSKYEGRVIGGRKFVRGDQKQGSVQWQVVEIEDGA